MKPRLTKDCRNIVTYKYPSYVEPLSVEDARESGKYDDGDSSLKSWGKVSISDGVSDKDSWAFYLQSFSGFPSGTEAN